MLKNTLHKSLFGLAVGALIGFGAMAPANAAVVVADQSSAGPGGFGAGVDFWSFTAGAGTLTVDSLSEYAPFDLNGDGFNDSTASGYGIDIMIWLFADDGSLDVGDLIAENDDSGATFGDGSTTGLDSYLSVGITAGDYLLAVGWCCDFGAGDIIDGTQYEGFGFFDDIFVAASLPGYNPFGYQLTFDGVALSGMSLLGGAGVPAPGALLLLGFGLFGLGMRRRTT